MGLTFSPLRGRPRLRFLTDGKSETFFFDGFYGTDVSWLTEAVIAYLGLFIISLSPLSTAVAAAIFLIEEDALFYMWQDFGSGVGMQAVPLLSPWIIYVFVYTFIALILLLIATLRVRRQATR